MQEYDLSHNIKNLRLKKAWTQTIVADALDISVPAYSKIETGMTDINISRIEQIAKLYDLTAIELMIGDNPAELLETQRLQEQLNKKNIEILELQREVIELYKKLHK